jgi:hypothetical protein
MTNLIRGVRLNGDGGAAGRPGGAKRGRPAVMPTVSTMRMGCTWDSPEGMHADSLLGRSDPRIRQNDWQPCGSPQGNALDQRGSARPGRQVGCVRVP